MTNEVPDIVVDLPTYEQVEEVKKVVVNTGGMLVDVNDKKYKAVMHTDIATTDFHGEDIMGRLDEDLLAKYPTIAKRIGSVYNYPRIHLFDDVHFIMFSPSILDVFVVFVDMKNLTIINAINIKNDNFAYIIYPFANCFIDSKYIYIRGLPSTSSTVSFAVFDKTTFEFVTAIRNVENLTTPNVVFPGEIVLQGDRIIYVNASINNAITVLRLSYDSNGIPTGLTHEAQGSFGSGGGSPPRLLFGDSEYIYVGYDYGSNMISIEKKRYYKATKLFDSIATNNTASSFTKGPCIWHYKYFINNTRYIIACFQGSGISSFNMDTMSTHQNIASPPKNTTPVFDYVNGNYFAMKPSTPVYPNIGGKPFDLYFEYRLVGDLWEYKALFNITLSVFDASSGGNIPRETLHLSQRSTIFNGKLYGGNSAPYNGALINGTYLLDSISILNYYKEVR